MGDSELPACPFCGGRGQYENSDEIADSWIECMSCGARSGSAYNGAPEPLWQQRWPGWRPIETAPKDGRSVLGFADGEFATVRWYEYQSDFGPGRCGFWTLASGSDAYDGEWNPTHWQPLPDPPKED